MKVKSYERTYLSSKPNVALSIMATTPKDTEILEAFLAHRGDVNYRVIITGTTWTSGKGMTEFSVAFVSVQEIEDLDRYRKLIAQSEAELAEELAGNIES